MWTTVYVASRYELAVQIKNSLLEEGFMIEVEYFGEDKGEELYEILAPGAEAEDIQSYMMENGII